MDSSNTSSIPGSDVENIRLSPSSPKHQPPDQAVPHRDLPPDAHILIVEDDGDTRLLLARFLTENGMRATGARDGREMFEVLAQASVDLVLLDVMLPGTSGLDLCRALRERSDVAIIMLTAPGAETDRVLGLEFGADDYIAKPFSRPELLARIRAVLRRARPAVERLRLGQVTIDFVTLQAWSGSEAIELSHREFELLRYLAERPDRIVHRDELLREVWGYPEQPRTRAVDNAILRLRKKLEAEAHRPRFIHTVHGDGYCLTPAGSNQSPEGSEPQPG